MTDSILTDLAAELASLAGTVRYNKDIWIEIDPFLKAECFTEESNQVLYKVLKHQLDRNLDSIIDLPTIYSIANELGLKKFLGKDYLKRVFDFYVDKSNVVTLAKKIHRLSIARDLFYGVTEDIKRELVKVDGSEPLSHIVGIVENKVLDYTNNLSENNNEGVIKISKGLAEWLDYNEANPVDVIGLTTGWKKFDSLTGGLRRKTVTFLGSRPGMGKSLKAIRLGLYITTKHKSPVLLLDTEMDEKQHWPRILATMSGVTINEIERGTYAKNEFKRNKVREAEKKLSNLNFSYKSVAGCNFSEILAHARRWVVRDVGKKDGVTNDCLLIYDYFKLMSAEDITKHIAEHQAIGFQLGKLHDFVCKYDIPAFTFGQLNREWQIADSDRIERYSETIATLQLKTPEEIAETGGPKNGSKKLIIKKARFGSVLESSEDYINIIHEKEIGRMLEGMTRNEVLQQLPPAEQN